MNRKFVMWVIFYKFMKLIFLKNKRIISSIVVGEGYCVVGGIDGTTKEYFLKLVIYRNKIN